MEGCDRNKMEETKSGLRKTVEEHNFLLGDFQQNVDTTAKCLEIQLTKEIETLRSTKQTFVEDLVQLKAAKESQVKAVESLGLKVSKETKTLFNLKKQTRAWQEKARQNTLAPGCSMTSTEGRKPTQFEPISVSFLFNESIRNIFKFFYFCRDWTIQ